jgi:tRNA C32,U32 (ribose-2'-O)-methylase TrmJ
MNEKEREMTVVEELKLRKEAADKELVEAKKATHDEIAGVMAELNMLVEAMDGFDSRAIKDHVEQMRQSALRVETLSANVLKAMSRRRTCF